MSSFGRLFLILSAFLSSTCAIAMPQDATAPDPAMVAATTARLTALRDAFVSQAKTLGASCLFDAPKIEITKVPSFGNYEPVGNTLRISAWWLLDEHQKQFFFRLAGPDAGEDAAQRVFDHGTYGWVFVHELGHWWQACHDSAQSMSRYQREYDANRIAAAYWREHNPRLLQGLTAGFAHMLEGAPNPVPAGQTSQQYFNANYAMLAHTPDYTWFQARMVTDVNTETPPPAFAEALLHPRSDKR